MIQKKKLIYLLNIYNITLILFSILFIYLFVYLFITKKLNKKNYLLFNILNEFPFFFTISQNLKIL